VEHEILDDHPEAAGANLARQRRFRDRLERIIREAQLHVLVLEQLLILTRDGVTRLRQDLNQGGLVEFVQRADDRQAADEFGYEAVLDEVFRLEHLERRANVAVRDRLDVGFEAEGLLAGAPVDLLVETDERPAADEQDIGGIDLEEFLVRMLAAALRRHVGDGAFEDLQQRLLNTLAGHIARDRGILILAADLVDFIDVDDALLALLDVAARGLQQLQNDVFDVLADVACLGQRRRIDYGERNREKLCQCLGEEGLAGAGRTNQQDV